MNYHLAVDGVSLTMVLVTGHLRCKHSVVFMGCRSSPARIFLLVVAGGWRLLRRFPQCRFVFALRFYELVIVPKYFLIAIFGSTNKEYGAMKLTLYSFFGGMFVFAGILVAYVTAGSLDLNQLAQFHFQSAAPIMGISRVVPRIRCACRHLAVAYLGADGPRRRTHRRVDVACRHRDETGFLCRSARSDESVP